MKTLENVFESFQEKEACEKAGIQKTVLHYAKWCNVLSIVIPKQIQHKMQLNII
jgi:hypothetical protein